MALADTELLIDLIARKHECLQGLSELSRRQQSLIDLGDTTSLLTLLAAKQRQIEHLQEIERRLDPYRRDDPDRRRWSSEAERTRCASLAEQAARLLTEVMETERRCEESLRRRRDETAEQLAVVHSAGMARGAYLDAAADARSVLDLTAET